MSLTPPPLEPASLTPASLTPASLTPASLTPASLTMVHLPISPRGLFTAGRAHGLVRDGWAVDTGYLVHALFARLFGDLAPKPFDVQENQERSGHLSVLGYATCDHAALGLRANALGDEAAAAIAWDCAGSRAMPTLSADSQVGFRVRVCPVIRVGKHHPCFAPGAEIDPYLALKKRRWADPMQDGNGGDGAADEPTREAVYREWVVARMNGAAELLDTRLVSLRDARLWRKGTPGEGVPQRMHGHRRPEQAGRTMLGRREAVFEGRLRVRDAAAFSALLARGVGRHRAFGFGMLLLRPVMEDGPC
jgi:CRISPR system Cascade subunit CasE